MSGMSRRSASSLTGVVTIRPDLNLASSGGEYHAESEPAKKRSRSAACGRAPLSA